MHPIQHARLNLCACPSISKRNGDTEHEDVKVDLPKRIATDKERNASPFIIRYRFLIGDQKSDFKRDFEIIRQEKKALIAARNKFLSGVATVPLKRI
jgi:hypothetical protein